MEVVRESRVELIKHNAADLDVARAAWVSNYGEDAREKDGARVKGLINYLYREKHMSPFEHGSFTFFVETPIFVAREFMRHRTASYNETSGRYMELAPRFYLVGPDRPMIQQGKVGNYTFVSGDDAMKEFVFKEHWNCFEYCWLSYQRQLERGVAKEVARNVLNVAIMTQFYVTLNPRNLMQFLTLRDADNALYEIRDVARQMSNIFAEAMPMTHEAFAKAREQEKWPLQTVDGLAVGGYINPSTRNIVTDTINKGDYVVHVDSPEVASMKATLERLNAARKDWKK